MSDEQDRAEALDDDKLEADFPPDEPRGVDEPEVTGDGEWARESLEERSDRLADEDPDANREIIQPYVDPSQDVLDDEAQAVADVEPRHRDQQPDDGAPPAAEEAALHIEPEA